MTVNQSPHSISEEYIHFLRFDKRSNFTLPKFRMNQCLSPAICPRRIVRRGCFRRNTPDFLGVIGHARSANWTTHAGNPSSFCYRGNYVTSRFVARKAHLLDSISNFKGSLFFHIRSSANHTSHSTPVSVSNSRKTK